MNRNTFVNNGYTPRLSKLFDKKNALPFPRSCDSDIRCQVEIKKKKETLIRSSGRSYKIFAQDNWRSHEGRIEDEPNNGVSRGNVISPL